MAEKLYTILLRCIVILLRLACWSYRQTFILAWPRAFICLHAVSGAHSKSAILMSEQLIHTYSYVYRRQKYITLCWYSYRRAFHTLVPVIVHAEPRAELSEPVEFFSLYNYFLSSPVNSDPNFLFSLSEIK